MGEDAAYFAVEEQSTGKWVFFTAELAIVLSIMYVVRHRHHHAHVQDTRQHALVRSASMVEDVHAYNTELTAPYLEEGRP